MTDASPNPDCPGCQALLRRVDQLLERVARLEAKTERLEARLRENSSNSNRPPSSDPPWSQPPPKSPPSDRRRGGQPGHERSDRKPLPPDEVHCCKPRHCEHCGDVLLGHDRSPRRHQVTEVPPARAVVVEYQLHSLKCRACGRRTRATLPGGVPRGAFGPRLQSIIVLLSGVYRISRRNVQQLLSDTFGVELSLGAISKTEGLVAETLAKPHAAALRTLRRAAVVHLDETSWKESNRSAWLWTGVSDGVSAFVIRRSRGNEVAKELLGRKFDGFHVSDRWSGYDWIDVDRRQVCWAHLIRDFRKIAESGRSTRWIGECLEGEAAELFDYWHRIRDGTLTRHAFRRHARGLRKRIRALLELGARLGGWRGPSLCRGILELEPAMWTFVQHEGVEPTNNDAERMLRPAVIWRKTSLGTQSERGSRFVERILTCVGTLRRRGRNVLDYLTTANTAALNGTAIPSFTR